jgi:uncharacterized protein (DUF1697 family)
VNTYVALLRGINVGRAKRISIGAQLGLAVRCVLRDRADLARVVADNPLADVAADPQRLLVSFTSGRPDPALVAALDPQAYLPERSPSASGRSTPGSPRASWSPS